MKKWISLILSAVVMIGLFAGCGKEQPEDSFTETDALQTTSAREESPQELVILFTNDIHNAYQMDEDAAKEEADVFPMGYAVLAGYAKELEEAGKTVVIIDGGDHLPGEPVGTLSEGTYLVDLMNVTGYDLAVPGENEFSLGLDAFLEISAEQAEYAYISCNLSGNGELLLPSYKMIPVGDMNIAFVGICTPETLKHTLPETFQNDAGDPIYSFAEGEDGQELYSCVQNAIDDARNDGADYVIAVGHLGIAPESTPWTSYEVISNTNGLTAFLDGHSHSVLEGSLVDSNENDQTLLVSAGSGFTAFAKIVLNLEEGTVSSELVTGLTEEDETVKKEIDDITGQYEALLETEVAVSEAELLCRDPKNEASRIVRKQETNLGDLCADAYRTALGADIALIPAGSIRGQIPKGKVTNEDIVGIQPYGEKGCLVEATGQQILDALELAYSKVGKEESSAFLQVSGITLKVDTSVGSTVTTDEDGTFTGISGQRRVSDVMIGGEAIVADRVYRVASTDYLLKYGAEGFEMFASSNILLEGVMSDDQILIGYITESLNGVIPASLYGEPKGTGRIEIL